MSSHSSPGPALLLLLAAARQLLEQAGGADAWRKRRFAVTENIYPVSGNKAEVRVVRDFESRTRRFEYMSAGFTDEALVVPSP